MFRWAGVDGVAAGSRGPYVDAKELAFLEKLTGEPFLQHGLYPNPMAFAGEDLNQAFDIALNGFFARLVAQGAGRELFEGDVTYNVATDTLEGITGLDLDTLDDLETAALGLSTTAEREIFWGNVVRLIDGAQGIDALDISDRNALDTAITSSDATLDLSDIEDFISVVPVTTNLDGTSCVDMLDAVYIPDICTRKCYLQHKKDVHK